MGADLFLHFFISSFPASRTCGAEGTSHRHRVHGESHIFALSVGFISAMSDRSLRSRWLIQNLINAWYPDMPFNGATRFKSSSASSGSRSQMSLTGRSLCIFSSFFMSILLPESLKYLPHNLPHLPIIHYPLLPHHCPRVVHESPQRRRQPFILVPYHEDCTLHGSVSPWEHYQLTLLNLLAN